MSEKYRKYKCGYCNVKFKVNAEDHADYIDIDCPVCDINEVRKIPE